MQRGDARTLPQPPGVAAGAEPGSRHSQSRHNERHQHGATRELQVLRERHSQSGAERGQPRLGHLWGCHGNWHSCVEWLQKYVRYGREELQCKEPPDVRVSRKVEHGILTLSCRAYRFYPSTIGTSWMKGMKSQIVPHLGRIEEFGTVEQWDGGSPPLLTMPCFPELESSRNLTLVVAVSVSAAISIVVLIGFGVWKLQSGSLQTQPGGHPVLLPFPDTWRSPHDPSSPPKLLLGSPLSPQWGFL
ncbi:class I histocompatibility antigen, F10 alpha chain-like [Passer domesticus]|uniref:class I histocompatibility antigen, F10 alpha chain-like n=1 Tax=Passer domesticus TaxID=48849 RepID=UPI0030FEA1C9